VAAALFTGASPASAATRLEGTWRVQVTTRDCTTGAPLLTFAAMLSFHGGGVLTGTTSNPVFQAGQRSPDHGVWQRVHGASYSAVSEAFILFDSEPNPPLPGFEKGTQRITQAIEMTSPNDFTSDATTEFFDVSGNPIGNGCATAVANRFE
jgi:hypothetical protein